MNRQGMKVDLGAVQETLVLPLWARARETEKDKPVVYDPHAKDIVERIDYDFSQIEEGPAADHQEWPREFFINTEFNRAEFEW